MDRESVQRLTRQLRLSLNDWLGQEYELQQECRPSGEREIVATINDNQGEHILVINISCIRMPYPLKDNHVTYGGAIKTDAHGAAVPYSEQFDPGQEEEVRRVR